MFDLREDELLSIDEAAAALDQSIPSPGLSLDAASSRVARAPEPLELSLPHAQHIARPISPRTDANAGAGRPGSAGRWRLSQRHVIVFLALIVAVQAIALFPSIRGRLTGTDALAGGSTGIDAEQRDSSQAPAGPAAGGVPAEVTPAHAPPVSPLAAQPPSTPAADVSSEAARTSTSLARPEAKAPAEPATGRLVVRSTPSGATVIVDGRRRGTTPLTLDGIGSGAHRVQIVSGDTTLDHDVTVERGGTTSVLIPLAESGWVDLRAPIDLQVLEAGRALGSSADGPLVLPAGPHRLELRNEALAFRGEAQVTVVAGEIARLRPTLPDGLLQVNAQPWAHVWVDGQPVGDTPLGNVRVALGRHQVRFQHPELGEQFREVIVSAGTPARVSVAFR